MYKRYTKEDRDENKIPDGKVWGEFKDGEFAQPEFETLKDVQWEWTEKVDGTNIRIMIEVLTWDMERQNR